jgi:hypothetical protein
MIAMLYKSDDKKDGADSRSFGRILGCEVVPIVPVAFTLIVSALIVFPLHQTHRSCHKYNTSQQCKLL